MAVSGDRPQAIESRIVHGMPIPGRYDEAAEEAAALDHLAVCYLGLNSKATIKGPAAEAWLRDLGIAVPENVYDFATTEGGGVVLRVAKREFAYEPSLRDNATVLDERVDGDGTCILDRQDATLLLVGPRSSELIGQTCSLDLTSQSAVVLTRLAGVSCTLIQQPDRNWLRLWVEPSYAEYVWDVVTEIATDLGGRPIGVNCLWESLTGA